MDAIKLQTYTAATLTLKSHKPDFLIPVDSPWQGKTSLYELYEDAYTPWEWHGTLFEEARSHGLEVFSSPFDPSAVEYLENLDCPAYKIASPEITDIGLLSCVARTGKPVILSAGLADIEDLELAVKALRHNGCQDLVILKCTSAYPAPAEESNLRTIPDLAERFQCLAGLSDHTLGSVVPIGATALGASLIEKHLVLDRRDETVDSFFSLDREAFAMMVRDVRAVEKAIGKVDYRITESAAKNLRGRRSLYISEPIRRGERFRENNVQSVRPGFGLHPKHLNAVLGKKATMDLEMGDRVEWSAIEGGE